MRGCERQVIQILEKKEEEKVKKFCERDEVSLRKKKMNGKRTAMHIRHLGDIPFRDVRVECFSLIKRCRVKIRKETETEQQRGEK